MLIEFRVTNFRSFRERQILSCELRRRGERIADIP